MGVRVGRSASGNMLNLIILGAVGCFMVLPLVYTVCNAFKPMDELFRFPPRILVQNPTLTNFSDLGLLLGESWVPFPRYIFNTALITVVGLGGHIICASMAAYALEKRKFPGRDFFFKVIVATLMFTPAVTQIPNFIIMKQLGWVDSLMSVIVPAFGAPIGLYLMKQFMSGIPDSLLEAAKIDGASEWYILWKVVMPNLKPAWLTLSMFTIQSLWNATGGVYIFSEQKKTLSYAMSQIVAGGVARAGAGAAVGVIMLIVPITVFVLSQSNILETMASSGMKE